MYIETLETNITFMKLYKNLNGTSGHTKATYLIIDIIKQIKISGYTVPLMPLNFDLMIPSYAYWHFTAVGAC